MYWMGCQRVRNLDRGWEESSEMLLVGLRGDQSESLLAACSDSLSAQPKAATMDDAMLDVLGCLLGLPTARSTDAPSGHVLACGKEIGLVQCLVHCSAGAMEQL